MSGTTTTAAQTTGTTKSSKSAVPRVPCPAVHLPWREGAEELAWHESRRFARVRVVAWTCHEHRATWYELCEAGGLAFIRRHDGRQGKQRVRESHAWPLAEARRMWVALLSGQVR
ncbi:hypothetical protein [Thermostaphylospora chromogena]|uniref:Uncharacterized protein n=1 Tax=Thermostaphylospora chromogena TaxID=35622 RepID=A0A1H1DN01_9ACTN|nr:hypothetical protein [Thermostaphylospora chromogena]SDQ77763.1 hypothetical protein SAMN04489764_2080 [Thermostaphylospora chromogena]